MSLLEIVALLTPALGALAIYYGLRFFPVTKARSDQLELDLDIVPDFIKRTRAAAHEANRAADMIREETNRLKTKPRIKK